MLQGPLIFGPKKVALKTNFTLVHRRYGLGKGKLDIM